MKFSLWTDHGALNSEAVFSAFAQSLSAAGHQVVYNEIESDVDVIWSVLWYGRMSKNKSIWDNNKKKLKPTIVLEVGGIKRNNTWKVGIGGINKDAYFGDNNNDSSRAELLRLKLKPWRTEGDHILICGQHERSLQWDNMPQMVKWTKDTIVNIQKHSVRPIIIRPHPRCRMPEIELQYNNVYRETPKKTSKDRFDDNYDLNFKNVWATVSWSSNPGIHSVIEGVPAFTGPSSIAYTVANNDWAMIENPIMPERQQWLNDYAWTEFSIKEIKAGLPLKRLTKVLNDAIIIV
jgi:hypothetical protein